MEFQLINTQIGINKAVKIIKKIDIPSTPNITNLNPGSTLDIHSNLFTAWNWPSPSKEAHKRIVAVNVNKDHSKPTFHKRIVSSLGVIKRANIPIKGKIIIDSNIFSF